MDRAPWLATGETQGRWVEASDLAVGDAIRQADGTTGMVQAVVVVERRPALDVLAVTLAHRWLLLWGERKGKPNGLQDRQQGRQRWIAFGRKNFIKRLAIQLGLIRNGGYAPRCFSHGPQRQQQLLG